MATINIPESEKDLYKKFISGEQVKVEAVILNNDADFRAGSAVTICHLNMAAAGRIVSRPDVVTGDAGEKKVCRLVVERTGEHTCESGGHVAAGSRAHNG